MRRKERVATAEGWAAVRPAAQQLDLIVCLPVGCDQAEGRPPGVYINADGAVAEVIFAGAAPDPTVLDPVLAQLLPGGMLIMSDPSENPYQPSADGPSDPGP